MGYTIRIGELLCGVDTYEDEDPYTWYDVIWENHGPADDSPTSGTNSRWPSYSGWSDFHTDTKIPKELVINDHPGYVHITDELISVIQTVNIDKLDEYNKERFIWFKYWCEWAIKNCKTPVIVNS